MRFRRVAVAGESPLVVDFHPQVTVIQGLSVEARRRLVDALAGIVTGQIDGTDGLIEVQGIEFGIDPDTVALLAMRSPVDIVLRASQLPPSNEQTRDLSDRLGRARALRREMSGRLEAKRAAHRLLLTEAGTLAAESDRAESDGAESDRAESDRAASDRATALALARRKEQPEGQRAAPPSSSLRPRRDWTPAEAHDAALAAARLTVDHARRALHEAQVSRGTGEVSRADVDALERAHRRVLELGDRAAGRLAGQRSRRRLDEAEGREREALQRLGFDSYAEFVISASIVDLDAAELEASAAALATAEEALAALERRAGMGPPAGETVIVNEEALDDVGARRAELRGEIEALLGHPVGPSPAAELRAVENGDGVDVEPSGPVSWGPVLSGPVPSGSVSEEGGDRGRDLAAAIKASALDIWMSEMEAASIDERIVELQQAVRSAQPARPPTDEERLAHREAVEWYVLTRMSAQRRTSVAGSLPFVLDDPFVDLCPQDTQRLVEEISRMADTLQVVIVSDDIEIGAWATAAGSSRAAVVGLARPGVR